MFTKYGEMFKNILRSTPKETENAAPVIFNRTQINTQGQQEKLLLSYFSQIQQLAESQKLHLNLRTHNEQSAKENIISQQVVFRNYISPTDHIRIVYTTTQGSQMQGYDPSKKEWLIAINTNEYNYDALLFVGAHELAHILNEHHSVQQYIEQLTDSEIEILEAANTGEFYRETRISHKDKKKFSPTGPH